MPSSSEQTTQPISVNSSSTPKQALKSTPPGGPALTKKERKNGVAKDGGGTPAVTKAASKMSGTTKLSAASTPSDLHTPEIKPGSALPTTSPLLDALPANAFNTSTEQNTNDWAKNVPAYSGSPGNLISLAGSPPTVPSSYEDRSTLATWNQGDHRISNGRLPSTSPPVNRWRPLSYQMDGHQPYEDQTSQNTGFTYRRSSMYSQQSQRYSSNPPLPHQPQAHFYGAPDPNFGLPSRATGMRPGLEGYYCGFDSLPVPGPSGTRLTDSVLISGYEGGFDIFGVSKLGLKKILGLDGLQGGVYYAKVLPWTAEGSNQQCFPLIVVILNGPVLPASETSTDDITIQAISVVGSPPRSTSVRGSSKDIPTSPPTDNSPNSVTHFQTTVEVYSLNSKRRISTLLSLPKVPLKTSITSSLFSPPPPAGSLSISADAGSIVVASGLSGEIWIYRQIGLQDDGQLNFRCIGKAWTTVQQARVQDSSSPSDFANGSIPFTEASILKQQQKTALFSLKGRWLAYSPPPSTSQASLRASVSAVIHNAKVPGLNTFAPPQVPPINCAVDMPEGETLLNRVAREATQAAIKGARWVGDQGYQVWNSYWNKSTPNSQPHGSGNPGQFWTGPQQSQQDHTHGFPPTHGEALQHAASNNDPILVSILDIEKLATLRAVSSAIPPHPFATFKAPLGCSFISFSPNGLALFTASSKGEVQFVWDLMRIQYNKSSALQAPHLATLQAQHIRQVAIFTRMTPARIVEIVWTMPHGERIAMVTDRSTVHFWDLPPTAFTWPPPRRRIRAPHQKIPASGDIVEAPKSAATIASSAVSAAWNLAQPLIKRPRGLSGPGRPGISAASVTAQAGHGGKALANGISKSFGAATGTIESFYKSGENRLHLPRGTAISGVGCIKWIGGKQKDYLAAVVEGTVMIYTIKQRKTDKRERQQISIGRKPVKMEAPLVPDHKLAPAILRALELEDELNLTETDVDTHLDPNWMSVVKADGDSSTDSSIPQAEIESNAPYQPFHTDRRVSLFVYSNSIVLPPSPSVSALLDPLSTTPQPPLLATEGDNWVFGMPIGITKLDIGTLRSDTGDSEPADNHFALPSSAMERVTTKISEPDEDVEQIVITTRRRKGTVRGNSTTYGEDEDGFFEDDCEVLDFASQRV